jgi:hypothetical protein
MNINVFDSAIIVAAISGGIMGALVAVVVSLGVIRAQRHIGGTTVGTPQPSSEWRAPSGPLGPARPDQREETVRPRE